MPIDHIDLGRLDLNLLVALDALLDEASVTRAAARIGIGQSAMSASLARLRRVFGDELLTRTSTGMRPTPRAMILAEPVRATLAQIQGLLRPPENFEPKTLSRVFRLAVPDSMEVLLVPRLLADLRAEAPGVRVMLRAFERVDALREIDADRLDLAVGGFYDEGRTHHKRRILFREPYLCLFNPKLLGATSPISLDDFLRVPHVLTSLNQTPHGVVDDALARIGRRRHLAITTPRFLAVPFLIESAPMITTMVSNLAVFFAARLDLATSPVPVPLEAVENAMVWHASYDADPAHRWLRDRVFAASAAMR